LPDQVPPLATILVVDDTPGNIDILQGILAPAYRVKVASSGARALEIASQGELLPARSAEPDLDLQGLMKYAVAD